MITSWGYGRGEGYERGEGGVGEYGTGKGGIGKKGRVPQEQTGIRFEVDVPQCHAKSSLHHSHYSQTTC